MKLLIEFVMAFGIGYFSLLGMWYLYAVYIQRKDKALVKARINKNGWFTRNG